MVLLKKIETPQDIFILGVLRIEGVQDSFLIDECGFYIASGKSKIDVGSFGGCIILTKEELVANRYKIDMNDEDIFGDNSVLIENFVGDINLRGIDNGIDVITEDNFKIDDFINHQFSNYLDIIVDIGE